MKAIRNSSLIYLLMTAYQSMGSELIRCARDERSAASQFAVGRISLFQRYLRSLASFFSALPPCSMSWPAPATVLQPATVPNKPARKSAASSDVNILLIMTSLQW
jgi:hypothetical protein